MQINRPKFTFLLIVTILICNSAISEEIGCTLSCVSEPISSPQDSEPPAPEPKVCYSARTDADTVTLYKGKDKILSYWHAAHDVPEGVDPLYRRSGFIHPLWSPEGKVLTRIQPPDHYHHYGIWNPWTKTVIDGKEVDFWNLGKGQGTVRFAKLLSTSKGPVFCGFTVKQEHLILNEGDGKDGNTVAMHEIWDIRATELIVDEQPGWLIDFTIRLSNALETPIELSAYRYGGGLGFRATDEWVKENCAVLTSEGKTRTDADNTGARWCDVRGGEGKTAGIVFMSHEENHGHPEPMRVWPDNSVNGKGLFFFGFTPTRHESWTLEPGKEYVLKYRMYVYDGTITRENAERLWDAFVHPPPTKVQSE